MKRRRLNEFEIEVGAQEKPDYIISTYLYGDQMQFDIRHPSDFVSKLHANITIEQAKKLRERLDLLIGDR